MYQIILVLNYLPYVYRQCRIPLGQSNQLIILLLVQRLFSTVCLSDGDPSSTLLLVYVNHQQEANGREVDYRREVAERVKHDPYMYYCIREKRFFFLNTSGVIT